MTITSQHGVSACCHNSISSVIGGNLALCMDTPSKAAAFLILRFSNHVSGHLSGLVVRQYTYDMARNCVCM